MIRLRGKDGKTFIVNSNVQYIELCDQENNLIALIRTNDGETVEVHTAGSIIFENYKTAYHKKQAVVLQIERK